MSEQAEKKTDTVKAATPRPAKTGSGGGWLVVVLAIAALAGVAWLWQQQQLHQQQVAQQWGAFEQGLMAHAQSLEQLQGQLAQLALQHEQALERLRDRQAVSPQQLEQVEQQLRALRGHLPTQLREWSLAEVDYLLRIAEHRLQLERQPATAIAALQQAEHTLRMVDEPRFVPLQQSIQQDIARLRGLVLPDTDHLAEQLAALVAQVSALPLKTQGQVLTMDAHQRVSETSVWQRFWGQVKSDLAKLVVVRQQEQPWYHSPVPGQQQQLQAILQLRLEMARLALQTAQQSAWQQTLAAAQQWLNQHFDPRSDLWQEMNSTLGSMHASTLQPAMPRLDRSLALIEQLLLNGVDESSHDVDGGSP